MNPAQAAIVEAHVKAVTKLLLGNATIAPGLAILAGEPLDPAERLAMASLAMESEVDLVHLAFTIGGGGVLLMGAVGIFVARDNGCFGWTDCRLSMRRGQARAVIAPPLARRGVFKVLPDEIVQVDAKPAWLEEGAGRAAARLGELVRTGVDVRGQARIDRHDRAA